MEYDREFRPGLERPASPDEPVAGRAGTLAAFAELVRDHLGCDLVVICLAARFADLLAGDGPADAPASGECLNSKAEPARTICAITSDTGLPLPEAALADPARLAHPIAAGDLGFAFYAGLPLRLATGEVLGTLAALARTPRDLSVNELATLRMLAGIVVQLAELRLAVAGGDAADEGGA